jgi:4,5-DOPA dioxygenase extradiol
MLPALFIGHGSPMNIVLDNDFTRDMTMLGKKIEQPEAILVLSAHWLTRGTFITSSESPEQIYDFYGFPPQLYKVRYSAPGSPEAADTVIELTGDRTIKADPSRGIDHAAWTILKYLRPGAEIPVLELSLDISKPTGYHFELGKGMREARERNILVIGSGNIIHNLRDVDFNDDAEPFGWALEFDEIIRGELGGRDYSRLIDYDKLGPLAKRAIPYFDHYLPMLYILGMKGDDERLEYVHDSIQNGSVSMRSFVIGEL